MPAANTNMGKRRQCCAKNWVPKIILFNHLAQSWSSSIFSSASDEREVNESPVNNGTRSPSSLTTAPDLEMEGQRIVKPKQHGGRTAIVSRHRRTEPAKKKLQSLCGHLDCVRPWLQEYKRGLQYPLWQPGRTACPSSMK